MMKLKEFNKPDYANMTEEELHICFQESLLKLEKTIDKSNERIENGLQLQDKRNLHKVS